MNRYGRVLIRTVIARPTLALQKYDRPFSIAESYTKTNMTSLRRKSFKRQARS